MKHLLSFYLYAFLCIITLQASEENLSSKKRKFLDDRREITSDDDLASISEEFVKKAKISFQGVNLNAPYRIIYSSSKQQYVVYSYKEYIAICERSVSNKLDQEAAREIKKELYRLVNKNDLNAFNDVVNGCMNLKVS